jgi:hypothetical protein
VYEQQGQFDAVFIDLDAAIVLAPERAELFVARAIFAVRRGAVAAVKSDYARAILSAVRSLVSL